MPDPAATLVLRISKADVDALAAGKLTAEQFAPKVQTLWSAGPAATQETADSGLRRRRASALIRQSGNDASRKHNGPAHSGAGPIFFRS